MRRALPSHCTRYLLLGVAAAFAWTVIVETSRSQDESDRSSSGAQPQPVERGKYLVHEVAKCIVCHTPHSPTGELQMQKLLQGAPIPVESPFPFQQWAFRAPRLAGLPGGWSKADLIQFLKTGDAGQRGPIRPPMPTYHMTQEDATAVVEYLQSL